MIQRTARLVSSRGFSFCFTLATRVDRICQIPTRQLWKLKFETHCLSVHSWELWRFLDCYLLTTFSTRFSNVACLTQVEISMNIFEHPTTKIIWLLVLKCWTGLEALGDTGFKYCLLAVWWSMTTCGRFNSWSGCHFEIFAWIMLPLDRFSFKKDVVAFNVLKSWF